MKKTLAMIAAVFMLVLLAVGGSILGNQTGVGINSGALIASSAAEAVSGATPKTTATDSASGAASSANAVATGGSALDVASLFTERDLEQTADLDGAVSIALTSGEDVTIDAEGVYVISGEASDVTISVDAGDDAKVQLVLDGVTITNADTPVIEIVSADKAFITLSGSRNHLEVRGDFETASMDAVIASKSDLTLNGTGSLEIVAANGDGVKSNDDLKVTGGTYTIAAIDALKANDSIRICGGDFTITAGKDALHSENKEDTSLGYIYISGASLDISAQDDGIQGNSIVQIDSGVINIHTSSEGIESTHVQINGGEIDIYATDDGINAAQKSSNNILLEINGGVIDINMASGDTDALDSNGDLSISNSTLTITANSAFDYNGSGALTGGTVTVNGQVVTQLTQSQMGGRMNGDHGGKPNRMNPMHP